METTPPTHSLTQRGHSRMMHPLKRLLRLRNLVALGVAAFLLSGAYVNQGTLALFTAQKTNATNTITTGTLALTATPNGGTDGGTLNTAVSDFIPGDFITKGVAVHNTGNID